MPTTPAESANPPVEMNPPAALGRIDNKAHAIVIGSPEHKKIMDIAGNLVTASNPEEAKAKTEAFDARLSSLSSADSDALKKKLDEREYATLLGGPDMVKKIDGEIAALTAEKPAVEDPDLKFAKGGSIDKEGVRIEGAKEGVNAKKAIESAMRELNGTDTVGNIIRGLEKQGRDADAAIVKAALEEVTLKGSEDIEGWLKRTLQTRGAFDHMVAEKANDYAHDNPDRTPEENYFDALGNRHDQAMAAAIVFKEIGDKAAEIKPISDEQKDEAAYSLAERIKMAPGQFDSLESRQKLVSEGYKVTQADGTEKVIKFTEDEVVAVLDNGLVRAEGVTPTNHAEGFRSNEEWDRAVFEASTGVLEAGLIDKITDLAETDIDKKIFEKAQEIWKKRVAAGQKPPTPPVEPPVDGPKDSDDGRDFEGEDTGGDTPPDIEEPPIIEEPPVDEPKDSDDGDFEGDESGGWINKPEDIVEPPIKTPDQQTGDPEADKAALEAAMAELNTYRDSYIEARRVTRSFWRNLGGWVKSKLSKDAISPVDAREIARKQYEDARDKVVRMRAEQAAKKKGFEVPEMPTPVADTATDAEKDAYKADLSKAELQKKQYDREILTQAVNQIALEKFALSKADMENMNRDNAFWNALDRLRKNPAVRMAITGGLLVSTGTGFLPGMMLFGGAEAALRTIAIKGGLDFGVEQFAARAGDERKGLSEERVGQMDQDERDRREAALAEMGIKRNKLEDSDTVKNIQEVSQADIDKRIQEMINKGEVKGTTPQERSAAVLAALLKEGNLNMAIDSKIDKNRFWNATRWGAALVGAGVWTGYSNDLIKWPFGPDGADVVPPIEGPVPTDTGVVHGPELPNMPQMEKFIPWMDGTGLGYHWDGWANGEISKYVGVPEAQFAEWSAQHPTEVATARNAVLDAMKAANPGVDFTAEGVLKQAYNRPNDLRSIINSALQVGGNAR